MTTKPHRLSLRRRINWSVTFLALALAPPVQAAFHFAHIDEIMASYNGNNGVQFIEIQMQFPLQNRITNAVIAVFDADGNFVKDAIVFLSNVPNGMTGDRFIVGTDSFATVSELTTDFTMAADLPTDGGMVCFGGGPPRAPSRPTRTAGGEPTSGTTWTASPMGPTPGGPSWEAATRRRFCPLGTA